MIPQIHYPFSMVGIVYLIAVPTLIQSRAFALISPKKSKGCGGVGELWADIAQIHFLFYSGPSMTAN